MFYIYSLNAKTWEYGGSSRESVIPPYKFWSFTKRPFFFLVFCYFVLGVCMHPGLDRPANTAVLPLWPPGSGRSSEENASNSYHRRVRGVVSVTHGVPHNPTVIVIKNRFRSSWGKSRSCFVLLAPCARTHAAHGREILKACVLTKVLTRADVTLHIPIPCTTCR